MSTNEKTKQKILTAATHLFAQKGFDAVSVREICKLAGVNLCMVSYYFGGKQDLYNAIIDELVEAQTEYAKSVFDFSIHPSTLSKQEQIELLARILDKIIAFFYSNISGDLILLLLKEQQNPNFSFKLPAVDYFGKVIAAVFDLEEESKEAVYQMVFILSQINCLRVFPGFSIHVFDQDTLLQEDINIIKRNIERYINAMLLEKRIEGRLIIAESETAKAV